MFRLIREAGAMQTTRKVAPDQQGAKRLLDPSSLQLVCVRCRSERQKRKRFNTIELIIEEAPWSPPSTKISGETQVGIHGVFKEIELQRQVKQAGGKWNPGRRVWEMRYDRAVALGLKDRIEQRKVSDTRNRESF